MTIALWCVFAAGLMPILWVGGAKIGGVVSGNKYNNRKPRKFLGELEGWPARANWAQNNAFEAFPFFAAAIIIAHQVGVIEQGLLDKYALAYIFVRVLHGVFYIADVEKLRSLVWFISIGLLVTIFIQSA